MNFDNRLSFFDMIPACNKETDKIAISILHVYKGMWTSNKNIISALSIPWQIAPKVYNSTVAKTNRGLLFSPQ